MTKQFDELLAKYRALDAKYHPRKEARFGDLVVPSGNSDMPFHRWYHMKEGFSHGLLGELLGKTKLLGRKEIRLLDPFLGVGTSALSAILGPSTEQWPRIDAFGIERNPFLHLVARTKVEAAQSGSRTFEEFMKKTGKKRQKTKAPAIPKLTTFHNTEFFTTDAVHALGIIRQSIEETEGTDLDKHLALVCLAGVVEASSKLRKDGRALRYEPNKQPCDPYIEFDRRAGMVSEDLAKRKIVVGSAKAILGDARLASMMLPAHAEFDLIVFSPPYPNNIDYTEVYKLEAWSLGFYEDYAAFREQRLLTLRSHPSIKFPDNFEISSNGFRTRFNRAVTPLRRAIPKDKDHAWRDRLVHGYFDDMLRVLVEMHSLLADDGQLAFVVGNSLHGSKENYFLVAADLLIAEIAESAGYRVSDFIVARQLPRKSGDYEHLRESVVILRKSDSPRGKHHA